MLQICPHYSCIGTTTGGSLDDAISHSCRLPSFLFSLSRIYSYQTDILRQSDKNSTHSKLGPTLPVISLQGLFHEKTLQA